METRLRTRKTGRKASARQGWTLGLLLTALGACGGPTEPGILQIYYDPSLAIDIQTFTQTPSGLFYKDTGVGQGALATSGSVVDFILEGWLPSGEYIHAVETVLDVTLGGGELMPGVDEGLRGMRTGGSRTVVIPPHLGHGSARVLVFKLELLAAR
jgi:FKBP-type peptidyl-prolyl cis-trans isomerase FkpA